MKKIIFFISFITIVIAYSSNASADRDDYYGSDSGRGYYQPQHRHYRRDYDYYPQQQGQYYYQQPPVNVYYPPQPPVNYYPQQPVYRYNNQQVGAGVVGGVVGGIVGYELSHGW